MCDCKISDRILYLKQSNMPLAMARSWVWWMQWASARCMNVNALKHYTVNKDIYDYFQIAKAYIQCKCIILFNESVQYTFKIWMKHVQYRCDLCSESSRNSSSISRFWQMSLTSPLNDGWLVFITFYLFNCCQSHNPTAQFSKRINWKWMLISARFAPRMVKQRDWWIER